MAPGDIRYVNMLFRRSQIFATSYNGSNATDHLWGLTTNMNFFLWALFMHNLNMGEGSKIPPSKLRRLVYRNGLIFQLREQRRFLLGLLSVLLVIFFWLLYSGAWSSTEDSAVPSGTDHKLDRTPLVRSSSAALTKNGRLFYNRVPKCGSSTLNALLKKLAAKNGYTYTSSPLLDDWFLVQPQAQVSSVGRFSWKMAITQREDHGRHVSVWEVFEPKLGVGS